MKDEIESFPIKKLGEYVFQENIGLDNSEVYKGFDLKRKRPVVIKIIDKVKNKLENEKYTRNEIESLKILSKIENKLLIKLYDVIENKKKAFIIMEYCNNMCSLNKFIKQNRNYSEFIF